jgi:hypothetical protein
MTSPGTDAGSRTTRAEQAVPVVALFGVGTRGRDQALHVGNGHAEGGSGALTTFSSSMMLPRSLAP